MKVLNNLIVFFIFFALLCTLADAQVDEDLNDFNASEHRFLGQEFVDMLGFGILICFIVLIIPIIIGLVLAIWIYKDANKRGKEGILWAVLLIIFTLFLNFIGILTIVIIWLAVRPPIGGDPQSISFDRRCPNCGRIIPFDAKICPYCANKFNN